MANTTLSPTFHSARSLVGVYVAITFATLAALAVLSVVSPRQAPSEAWTHAAVVGLFAVVLPLRLRSALSGSVGGLRAVGLIAGALVLANIVEGTIPGAFPMWMRVEMFVSAALMAGLVGLVVKERV